MPGKEIDKIIGRTDRKQYGQRVMRDEAGVVEDLAQREANVVAARVAFRLDKLAGGRVVEICAKGARLAGKADGVAHH